MSVEEALENGDTLSENRGLKVTKAFYVFSRTLDFGKFDIVCILL